jgi:hypothetical protein
VETTVPTAAGAQWPVPQVVRSRQELIGRGITFPTAPLAPTALPITDDGTRYSMAQSLAWLDAHHFAVGRWNGSLEIYQYTRSVTEGPLLQETALSPAFQGVRMVASLPGRSLVSSNDDRSLALWHAPGDWSGLTAAGTFAHDPALGVATSACAVRAGVTGGLAVGHTTGLLSIWAYDPQRRHLAFQRSVDLRNPTPVNPWGLHDINAVDLVTDARTVSRVVTGSEDGHVCVVEIPSGQILSQQVFNPKAERGINDLGVRDGGLLVANCSVGSSDFNLWYYGLDEESWTFALRDRVNLKIDPDRPQAFNFNTVWGTYSGGPCWFSSTEEGALWMGTAASSGIEVFGYQEVNNPLGSALGWRASRDGQGRLAMVAHDPHEFTT